MLKSAPHNQQASKPPTRVEKPASQASRGSKEASPAESGSDVRSQQSARTNRKATGKPRGLKREQSDLFKSFSKPKAKLNREETGSSAGDSPALSAAQSVSVHGPAGVAHMLNAFSPESQAYLKMVFVIRNRTIGGG